MQNKMKAYVVSVETQVISVTSNWNLAYQVVLDWYKGYIVHAVCPDDISVEVIMVSQSGDDRVSLWIQEFDMDDPFTLPRPRYEFDPKEDICE